MVWVMNSVMRQFTGPPSPPSSPSAVDVTGAGDARSGTNEILPWRGPLRMMWSEGTPMFLRVYLTEHRDFDRRRDHPKFLLWEERGLAFDWAEGNSRKKEMNITLTESVRRNGSVFAHVWFVRDDLAWNEDDKRLWSYKRIPMNVYKKAPKDKKLKPLLPSASTSSPPSSPPSSPSSASIEGPPPILSYWKPSLSLSLVHHFHGWPQASQLPSHLLAQVGREGGRERGREEGYVVAPLMMGYAAYSLLLEEHKGWYSWLVTSTTGFVYVFGFVMMTPQLYINFKLKSVAHLPWRTMVYKALNTFIDDLFAFVIKMPTMHRLSCFRDDVIFFIMLYQRYIYPVDRTRVNEFGQLTQDNQESEEAQNLLAAAGAPVIKGEEGEEGREGGREDGREGDGPSARGLAGSVMEVAPVEAGEKDGVEEEEEEEGGNAGRTLEREGEEEEGGTEEGEKEGETGMSASHAQEAVRGDGI
ncbi:hypothetical protein NSK_003977 [Nannochloropsis salina CCMP1776]|uniref:Cleft lip and palate transmembrane protein 1 n=1 Tax=Nannochloropsis salina CCMP1776 TaxID=1027361 RepID=A0A4D9D8L9_9STRA|nr:hypothetical protein NSK_003977 [Nannochloropsis salina CCMP1776]|eukprot:TFJ84949.1 hypothetical protein NSK_003977 [Nannochloropsis salina CCMP1776]